jgi:hypothetical protein
MPTRKAITREARRFVLRWLAEGLAKRGGRSHVDGRGGHGTWRCVFANWWSRSQPAITAANVSTGAMGQGRPRQGESVDRSIQASSKQQVDDESGQACRARHGYGYADTCFARGAAKAVLRCRLPQLGTAQPQPHNHTTRAWLAVPGQAGLARQTGRGRGERGARRDWAAGARRRALRAARGGTLLGLARTGCKIICKKRGFLDQHRETLSPQQRRVGQGSGSG